jgi:hypothetical protein
MERSAATNVFGIGWFDENRVDLDVVPTSNPSNPPVPSVRDALHHPAVAQRQPMVAQPFKAGRGEGEGLMNGSGSPASNLPNVVNQVRNAVVICRLVGAR